jgi:Transcriptional regulatory protein, C terminal
VEAIPSSPREGVAATSGGDRLRLLEAVVAELAARAPVERMAEVIGEAAASALAADLVVIALTDDDRRSRPVHATGVARGAVHQVLATAVDGPGLVAQPISVGARTLGRLVLGRRSERPFSERDRDFVHVLAGLFALAVDRPRALRRLLRVGGLAIDLELQEVSIDGRAVRLTPKELRLLVLLAEQPGRPRSRREILRHLCGADPPGHERACDVHISNLRRKVERNPSRPERLITLRGVGYALYG